MTPVPGGTDTSGLFWFFNAENWETLIRVVDGCDANGHYWVFAAAPTNVEYTLQVTDTVSGEVVEYHNPLGESARPVLDTAAFGLGLKKGIADRRRRRLGAATEGKQQQRRLGVLACCRDPAQQGDRGRVAERLAETLREHDPDRAGRAGSKGPSGRIRPRVSETRRNGEDLVPQFGRQLPRPVVRVRHGRARDTDGIGNRLQGRLRGSCGGHRGWQ